VVDVETSAKLKVSFFGPFYGNYWVLDHETIMSGLSWGAFRSLSLGAYPRKTSWGRVAGALQARVKALGYDWSLVRITRQ
jgi:apolipoprotein D and lipocalin family protein